MTNGPVEGINNKLRVIARRAYGFHSHSAGALTAMLVPVLWGRTGGGKTPPRGRFPPAGNPPPSRNECG